jgi:hypothetical protein
MPRRLSRIKERGFEIEFRSHAEAILGAHRAARMLFDVIARSEATKQSILSFSCEMDCFASLAMTVE